MESRNKTTKIPNNILNKFLIKFSLLLIKKLITNIKIPNLK